MILVLMITKSRRVENSSSFLRHMLAQTCKTHLSSIETREHFSIRFLQEAKQKSTRRDTLFIYYA